MPALKVSPLKNSTVNKVPPDVWLLQKTPEDQAKLIHCYEFIAIRIATNQSGALVKLQAEVSNLI